MRELFLRFDDEESLTRELDQNLCRGRAFVAGATGIEERSTCALVVVHPDGASTLTLTAEAVYVNPNEPGAGVGFKLEPFDASVVSRLRELGHGAPATSEVAVVATISDPPLDPATDELIEESTDELIEESTDELIEESTDESTDQSTDHFADASPDQSSDAQAEEGAASLGAADDAVAHTLHARLRRLSTTEQQKVARNGTLSERVMLERIYGPAVWETLLSNTRLSIPEVARIAKKGTLPRPLVEAIGAQAAWVAAGEVQRALLANPRSSPGVVLKVLRAMPRSDLARVPQQTAYPMAARQAAKKMLGGGS